MDKNRSLLGQRIRDARIERHISQRNLAKLSGVSFTTIQGIESGKRKTTANNLAAVFCALDNVKELDYSITLDGLDDDVIDLVLTALHKQYQKETISNYTWLQEEIIILVKKILHKPLLETLLDVSHAIYTEDLLVRGLLIGKNKTTEELINPDTQPNAIDTLREFYTEEASHATDEENAE